MFTSTSDFLLGLRTQFKKNQLINYNPYLILDNDSRRYLFEIKM